MIKVPLQFHQSAVESAVQNQRYPRSSAISFISAVEIHNPAPCAGKSLNVQKLALMALMKLPPRVTCGNDSFVNGTATKLAISTVSAQHVRYSWDYDATTSLPQLRAPCRGYCTALRNDTKFEPARRLPQPVHCRALHLGSRRTDRGPRVPCGLHRMVWGTGRIPARYPVGRSADGRTPRRHHASLQRHALLLRHHSLLAAHRPGGRAQLPSGPAGLVIGGPR